MDLKVLAVVLLFCFIVGSTAIQAYPRVTYPKSEYVLLDGGLISLDTRYQPLFGSRQIVERVEFEDGSMVLYVVS
jgi:hypothetical protein